MHGKNPTHSGHSMVYSAVLVALVSRRRSRSGRVKGMPIVRVLRRVWIPLVVLVVIGGGGFTVSRVHAIFGSEKHPAYADGEVDDTKPFNPKQVIYQLFGPAGTVAGIGYFDVNSDPQQVDGARLPWSLKITTTVPAVMGDIVAQGDSDSIGCRIVVDGEVKAERIADEVNAYTHCLVKGA
jgi:Mycobacterium membrane protein